GYKSEGVIPPHELSVRNSVNPSEVVEVGDEIETLVLQKEDDQGRMIEVEIRADKVRDSHCRTFVQSATDILQDGSYVTVDDDGRGTFHEVPFSLRYDIEPEFHEQVYEWLVLLVPDQEFDEFVQAIGCFLAIDEGPTAALSIAGPARTGKTLLGAGLGECFTSRSHVAGDVLVSRFNADLLTSPIIWVDEGIRRGEFDFADQFRKVVSGGALSIEKKGLERIPMDNVHRIILTANNILLLTKAIGEDARTDMDMGAISERVTHFDVRQLAADFLDSIGGRNGTRGWIKGDEPSQFIVAKHFMWIHENLERDKLGRIKRPQGQRLLCQGKNNPRVMQTAQATAGYTPEVVGFLNRHINSKKNTFAAYDGETVYIRYQALIAAMVEDRHPRDKVVKAVQAIFAATPHNENFRVPGAGEGYPPAKWKTCRGEVFAQHVDEIGEAFKPRDI
ncbi:hypothetical protein LCGC14_2378850, partial [marine sediment metagenome]